MAWRDELFSKIDSYREQIIDAQRTLVGVPALGPENGGQGELDKALVVSKWLEDLGMSLERVDAPDDRVESGLRPNVVATLSGGSGPARWVLSHLDVVPTGDLGAWSSDPWTLRVEGDHLYGRGTVDNHQGMLSSFFGLKAVLELGREPAGPAGLILVSDEETGSGYGLDHVLKARPDLFKPEDLIVVPDAGEPEGDFIEVAEKSILWLKVEVTGKQVHGSTPEKGINALYASARMMVEVRELGRDFPDLDPLFAPPGSTFEPTRKEAGVPNVNTIPGRDVFYMDCRVLPQFPLDQLMAAVERRFGAIAAETGVSFTLEPVQRVQAPAGTDPQAPVVRALQDAIKKVRGVEAKPGGVGGGTVAAFFRQRNLPVAVWNSWQHTAHMPDEYCLLSDLIADAKVFGLLFAGEE
jgi:succinyl-diaminopimelate desuccinylase